MKVLKNRYLIAGVCFLIAAIIAFAVLPGFYADREATATVYRAAESIPRGTQIEAKHLAAVEVGAFNLPANVITDPADVVGQYALIDIPQDDTLMPEKVGAFLFTETLDTLMKKDQRLVTVTVQSVAAGVSGHLEPGDVVSVVNFIEAYEMFETDPESGFDVRINVPAETVVYDELRSITVFDIENAKTQSMEDARSDEASSADPIPKTVTLIVTEEQALKLVEAEYSGKIHLVFEKRGVEAETAPAQTETPEPGDAEPTQTPEPGEVE